MAKAVVIAKGGKLIGVFTTINLAWDALCTLEGTDKIEEHLILADRRHSAKCDAVPLNYAKLCAQLRDMRKADIRVGGGDAPAPIKYGLWLTSLNELMDKVENETECSENEDVCESAAPQDTEAENEADQDEYQNLALFDREVVTAR
jgi:hypothetical protein